MKIPISTSHGPFLHYVIIDVLEDFDPVGLVVVGVAVGVEVVGVAVGIEVVGP